MGNELDNTGGQKQHCVHDEHCASRCTRACFYHADAGVFSHRRCTYIRVPSTTQWAHSLSSARPLAGALERAGQPAFTPHRPPGASKSCERHPGAWFRACRDRGPPKHRLEKLPPPCGQNRFSAPSLGAARGAFALHSCLLYHAGVFSHRRCTYIRVPSTT